MSTSTKRDEVLALRHDEAAKALGVSERTLWRWRADGKVPSFKTGTGKTAIVLYPLAALRKWIDGR